MLSYSALIASACCSSRMSATGASLKSSPEVERDGLGPAAGHAACVAHGVFRRACRFRVCSFDELTRLIDWKRQGPAPGGALSALIAKHRKGEHRMITISAFKWVPEFAQGQVRDLRARWALEEAGLPYRTRLLAQGDQDKPDYRALQPFGQVPVLEEDGLVLFESGAIVLHIGERSEALLPREPGARARATQWLIAALNSIEPFIMNVALIDLFYAN